MADKISIECRTCKNIFQVYPYRKDTAKFCSMACYNKDKKNRTSWNKGLKMSDEFRKNVSEGHMGQTPWNKGLDNIYSEESLNKMSKGHKKWYGDNDHPFLGKRHSKKSREKIGKSQIGRKHSEETKEKMKISQKKVYLSGKRSRPNHSYAKHGFRKDINHHVRSTWEANVARILIYENINYEYEPQTFDLGEMSYLPDFFIPSKQLYIEVKGWMDDKSKRQIELFSKDHWLIVIDEKEYKELSSYYKPLFDNWED